MIKVIKSEHIGTQQWSTSPSYYTKWEQSLIYQRLNDLDSDETNNVLSNPSIIPSTWVNRIASVKWNVGDVGESDIYISNASAVISYEENVQTSSTSKIGLMYVSDVYYAYNEGGIQNCSSGPYCLSWMVDTTNIAWTMTNLGYSKFGYYAARMVYTSGYAHYYPLNYSYVLYPTFYLNSDVEYTGIGDGSQGSPLQLS